MGNFRENANLITFTSTRYVTTKDGLESSERDTRTHSKTHSEIFRTLLILVTNLNLKHEFKS